MPKLALFGDIQVQIWQPCGSLIILVLLKALPDCIFGIKNCQFWHFLKIFCQNATKTSGNIAFGYTFAKIIIFWSASNTHANCKFFIFSNMCVVVVVFRGKQRNV